MEIIWILIGFFALSTMAFIAIAIFYPEWVGITGDKAREIQRHQHKTQDTVGVPNSSDLPTTTLDKK